jgi:hypothetical protein
MAFDGEENHIFSQIFVRANFFRLILTPFLKRQKPMDLRRLFCLFAHGTKATPLLWNKEGWIIAFCSVDIRDQQYLPF